MTSPVSPRNIQSITFYFGDTLTREGAERMGLPMEEATKSIRKSLEIKLKKLNNFMSQATQHERHILERSQAISILKTKLASKNEDVDLAKKSYDTANSLAQEAENIVNGKVKSSNRAKQKAKNNLNRLYQNSRVESRKMDQHISVQRKLEQELSAEQESLQLYERSIAEIGKEIDKLHNEINVINNNLREFESDKKEND